MNSTTDMKMPATDETAAELAATPHAPAHPAADKPHAADVERDIPESPEAVSDNAKKTPPSEVKWLGLTLPKPISDSIRSVQDFGQRTRNRTVRALPRAMVNHSSNVIATTQLVGEVMMFKANGTTLVPKEHEGVWWRYLVEPPKSIFNSVFKKAGGAGNDLKEIFTPGFYTKKGLELATKRDSLNGTKSLINRWQARATFAGLSGMIIAALLPDVKDTPEDLEKRATMAYSNPLGYGLKTMGEAVWFPFGTALELINRGARAVTGQEQKPSDIGKYKRQFTGLGITIAGMCSFLSGFRNVPLTAEAKALLKEGSLLKEALKPEHYEYGKNTAHSIGGIITAVAGSQLLFAVGSDQGWARFGSIQWLRMLFLPKSIGNRYASGEQGRHWYAGGQAVLQTTNTMSYLIGGAEKQADGSVIDHKEERKAAKEKAKEAMKARKTAKQHGHAAQGDVAVEGAEATSAKKRELSSLAVDETGALVDMAKQPEHHITHAKDVAHAMPERKAAHDEKLAAAASA